MEEAVFGCSLSRASNLATPEAAELGSLDSVAGHWNFEELGLDITAAGNVGVRRRIWRLHLRIFLSIASICWGLGGINWLVYVSLGMRACCSTYILLLTGAGR